MVVRQAYVIASTFDGGELSIEVYYSTQKAIKALWGMMDDEGYPEMPDPDDDPVQLVSDYYGWVRNLRDNMCQWDISIKVLDYTGHIDERQSDET